MDESAYFPYVDTMSKLTGMFDRSRVSLYLQVASVMRQRIETGRWNLGDKISTLAELEQEFGVARVTIRQAVEILQAEGLLSVQQGRGTFVSGTGNPDRFLNLANDFDSLVASLKENVIKQVRAKTHSTPPKLIPGEGKLADNYTFLSSVQYRNNEPFSLVNLHLAQNIFDTNPSRFKNAAALPIIVSMKDVSVAQAHQTLTIGIAEPATAELLKIGIGEPTADCRLVLVNSHGIAIYVAHIHYLRSCFTFRINLLENGVAALKR